MLPRRRHAAPFLALLGAIAGAAVLLTAAPARATPCASKLDCTSGFCVDQVCCDSACDGACQACSAAKKQSGADGTCGLAKTGSECAPGNCDGASFSFIGPSTCTAAGACVEPAPVPCLHDDPCKFDLCSDTGCDQATKLDGTDCGGGKVCGNGVCGGTTSSSSSSSGGAGGSGGAATSSSSSSSSSSSGAGGTTGGGGALGTGGALASTGTPSIYPPAQEFGGCGCRASGGEGSAGSAIAALVALAVLGRRRR